MAQRKKLKLRRTIRLVEEEKKVAAPRSIDTRGVPRDPGPLLADVSAAAGDLESRRDVRGARRGRCAGPSGRVDAVAATRMIRHPRVAPRGAALTNATPHRRAEAPAQEEDPEVEEELLANVVKVNGQWQFQSTAQPASAAKRQQAAAARREEERLEKERAKRKEEEDAASYQTLAQELGILEPEREVKTEDLQPGESLIAARFHPDYEAFIRLAQAGVDKKDLARIMADDGLDTATLRKPGKMVVLAAHLVQEKAKAQKAAEAQETEEEAEAAARKMRAVTHRRVQRVKSEAVVSLQAQQLELIRLADQIILHLPKLEHFIGIEKLGSADIGFSVEIDDAAVVKGVRNLLLGHEQEAAKRRKIYAASDEDELLEEEARVCV